MPSKYSRFLQLPWRSRAAIARDVDAELSFHLEMRIAELQRARPQCRRRAASRARGVRRPRVHARLLSRARTNAPNARRARSIRLAEWRQDVRYALRTLRRSPGFAAVTLLTLALAIGANTAIFSVARAVLLKPLPYGDPDALVGVFESWPGRPGEHTSRCRRRTSSTTRRSSTPSPTSRAFAGHGSLPWHLEGADPAMLSAAAVTPNLFSVLRVAPVLGRTFAPGDEIPGNDAEGHRLIRLLATLTRRRTGRWLAQPITLNGRRYELIGVMPRGFSLGLAGRCVAPARFPRGTRRTRSRTRKQHWVRGIGRLKPGVTIERRAPTCSRSRSDSRRSIRTPTPDRVAVLDSASRRRWSAICVSRCCCCRVPRCSCCSSPARISPTSRCRARSDAVARWPCAPRSAPVARGWCDSCSPSRCSSSTVGGVLGIGLAIVATRTLLALNPDALPPMFTVGVDARVLLFSLALSIATGVVFGVLPALDAARADLHDSLKESGRGSSGGRGGERMRRALVVAQVGLAVMLLVGAGLLIRSFGELTRVRLGFDPDHVLTAQIRAAGERYDSIAAINRFYDGVIGDIATRPASSRSARRTCCRRTVASRAAFASRASRSTRRHIPDIGYISVRGDYFKALRIPLARRSTVRRIGSAGRSEDGDHQRNGGASLLPEGRRRRSTDSHRAESERRSG